MISRTSSGGNTTGYLLGDLFETNGTGAITTSYVDGPNGDLSQYAGPPVSGSTVDYLYYNAHGDLAAEADGSGTRTTLHTYDPFGAPLDAPPADSTSHRFTGAWDKQDDSTSGLILMGARPYDPALGRFLAVDPIDGGSLNNYDYAGQDPVNGYDLSGQMEVEDPGWQCYNVGCGGNWTGPPGGDASVGTIMQRVSDLATGLAKTVVVPAEAACALGAIPACALADVAGGILLAQAGIKVIKNPTRKGVFEVTVGLINLATGKVVEEKVSVRIGDNLKGKQISHAISLAIERASGRSESMPPELQDRGPAPKALTLFWVSLGLGIAWGLSASGLGLSSVVARALGVVAGAFLVFDGALLMFGFRDSTNRTVRWLRAGRQTYLSMRSPTYWRVYGLLLAFIGVVALRVAVSP